MDGGALVVGLGNGTVNLYESEEGTFMSTLTRFSAVRARQVGMIGDAFIVAASEEPGIRIIDTGNSEKVSSHRAISARARSATLLLSSTSFDWPPPACFSK